MSLLQQRLQGLLTYAREISQLKHEPISHIRQHNSFFIVEHKLKELSNVRMLEEDEEGTVIVVSRVVPPAPPSIPKILEDIIDASNYELVLAEDVTVDGLTEKELNAFHAFKNKDWATWQASFKAVRPAVELYSKLFEVYQRLTDQMPGPPVELVLGLGVSNWQIQNTEIFYPLITCPLRLELYKESSAFKITLANAYPSVELDYHTHIGIPGAAEANLAILDNLQDTDILPFKPETYRKILNTAATYLDVKGKVHSPIDRKLPKTQPYLQITDTWVIMARPKNNSMFLQDILKFEGVARNLGSLSQIPKVLEALFTEPANTHSVKTFTEYRGVSSSASSQREAQGLDLYFPKPYNDEQVKIVQFLDTQDAVVVQGPPGTGKTHTISNIVCHYMSLGKKVLVTSQKETALAVLHEKLPSVIQPLSLSLMSNDAEGMAKFDKTIANISLELGQLNKEELVHNIRQGEHKIEQAHLELFKINESMKEWATYNLTEVQINGQVYTPMDIVQFLKTHPREYTWFKDSINYASIPLFDEQDVLILQQALQKIEPFSDLHKDHGLASVHMPTPEKAEEIYKAYQEQRSLFEHATSNHGSIYTITDIQAVMELAAEHSQWKLQASNVSAEVSSLYAIITHLLQNTISSRVSLIFEELAQYLALFESLYGEKIEYPIEMIHSQKVLEHVKEKSAGNKSSMFASLLPHKDVKFFIPRVRVNGLAPKSTEDWRKVSAHIDLQFQSITLYHKLLAMDSNNTMEIPEFSSETPMVFFNKLKAMKIAYDLSKQALALYSRLDILSKDCLTLFNPQNLEEFLTIEHTLHASLCTHAIDALNQQLQEYAAKLDTQNSPLHEEVMTLLGILRSDSSILNVIPMYDAFYKDIVEAQEAYPAYEQATTILEKIAASGGVEIAHHLKTTPYSRLNLDIFPLFTNAWHYSQVVDYLKSVDSRAAMKQASQRHTFLEKQLMTTYSEVVRDKTWLALLTATTPRIKTALENYRSAVRKMGKGTGAKAPRYRKEIQQNAQTISSVIPCWILPHAKVSEMLPAEFNMFDLVIIDEASQSDWSALPSMLRAKKILVVGDDKQVSPDTVGLEEDKIRRIMSKHLSAQVPEYRSLMSPDRSIYDLFKSVFADNSIMLREHFRCVPSIIEYSNREFYNNAIIPLRIPPSTERLDPPLVDVFIENGVRKGNTNEAEAQFIVEEVLKLLSNPKTAKKSIGVVSLQGPDQAKLIFERLRDRVDPKAFNDNAISCGDAKNFQGRERDIVFLSMMVDPMNQKANSGETFEQRYNVAASRAKDRMYLVRSVEVSDLSSKDALRSGLIKHFQNPYPYETQNNQDNRSLCESEFELEMFDFLIKKGYKVIPQVKAGKYRIDMVVEDLSGNRLAIECDGDRYHGPDKWEQDIHRQRILERAGWKFWRCFASTFAYDREGVLLDLLNTLHNQGINPQPLNCEEDTTPLSINVQWSYHP